VNGLIAILGVSLSLIVCSRDDKTVARFGRDKISLKEFTTAYLEVVKQPNVFDSPELRGRFLQEMIDRRLLAEEARRLKLDDNDGYRLRVGAFHDKVLRDAHYEAVIKPGISYRETDLQRLYAWSQEERHLRHLFSPTRSGADSLYQLLKTGRTFEGLAESVFADSELAASGGDLGWVTWQQLEYDLAMAAFSAPVGTFTEPVASTWGYHIIQVLDFRKRPLQSEDEYQLQRSSVRSLLESKLGQKAAAQYITRLMANKKMVVHSGALRTVGEVLGSVLRRRPNAADRMRPMQLTDIETRQLESRLWERRNEPLAEMDGKIMSVGEFIAALNYIPYEAVCRSYKTALDYALRDRALTMEAKRLGLDNHPVRLKTRLFEDYVLQMALRQRLREDVRLGPDDVRSFYEQNRQKRYSDQPFDAVRPIVEKDAMDYRRNHVVDEWLKKMRESLDIRIDLKPIEEHYRR